MLELIPRIVLFLALCAFAYPARAADIYVSPDGNDHFAGTREKPLATLAAARDKARSFAAREAVTVHVADGIYYLPQTLVFSPQDSGSETYPITYQAENEGRAVLSGGTLLELSWEPFEDGIYQAMTPSGMEIDQLFVDGQNQRMARYPDFDPTRKTDAYQGFAVIDLDIDGV